MILYKITSSNTRFVKKTSKRNVKSHLSNKLKLKLSKSATNLLKRYAMVKVQKNVELFTNHLAPPNMLKSNLENLLETPLVKSCPSRFVELDVLQKSNQKNVTTRR